MWLLSGAYTCPCHGEAPRTRAAVWRGYGAGATARTRGRTVGGARRAYATPRRVLGGGARIRVDQFHETDVEEGLIIKLRKEARGIVTVHFAKVANYLAVTEFR